MTEIEKKALALVNEFRLSPDIGIQEARTYISFKALCRAIEQLEAFRQEVSDAVEESIYTTWEDHPSSRHLTRFIIPKPDPLVEAVKEANAEKRKNVEDWTDQLRAALAARGLKIVEDK